MTCAKLRAFVIAGVAIPNPLLVATLDSLEITWLNGPHEYLPLGIAPRRTARTSPNLEIRLGQLVFRSSPKQMYTATL